MKVLVACEFSGIVRDAFIRKGHDAMSCDLLDCEREGPHYKGDVRDVIGGGFDLMIAHPTCTTLTNAGVRWLHQPSSKGSVEQRWNDMRDAAEFYLMLRNAPIEKRALENPIMHRYARELLGSMRRQIVQPWWFGDKAFKATGLELHGLPDLIPTNKLTPPKSGTAEHRAWSEVHMASPGPDRWKNRSRTYLGIAEAMASQWG